MYNKFASIGLILRLGEALAHKEDWIGATTREKHSISVLVVSKLLVFPPHSRLQVETVGEARK